MAKTAQRLVNTYKLTLSLRLHNELVATVTQGMTQLRQCYTIADQTRWQLHPKRFETTSFADEVVRQDDLIQFIRNNCTAQLRSHTNGDHVIQYSTKKKKIGLLSHRLGILSKKRKKRNSIFTNFWKWFGRRIWYWQDIPTTIILRFLYFLNSFLPAFLKSMFAVQLVT